MMLLPALAIVLTLQTLPLPGSISGVAVDGITGNPVADASVTLVRTDVRSMPELSSFFTTRDVPNLETTLPGEFFVHAVASKGLLQDLADAGIPTSDIREVAISPQGRIAISTKAPVRTDSAGRFVFSGVTPGIYCVTSGVEGCSKPIVLASGQNVSVIVRSVPSGAVEGRIRGENRQPLAEVSVQLFRFAYDAFGQKVARVVASARTDDRGEYRLFSVPPGGYYLQARLSWEWPWRTSVYPAAILSQMEPVVSVPAYRGNAVPESYPNTFYPGVMEISAATIIKVEPSADLAGMDFTLSRPRTYPSIRGRVVDSKTGLPPSWAGILLTIRRSTGIVESSQRSDSNYDAKTGAFEVRNVAPGSYTVVVRSIDYDFSAVATITDSDIDLGVLTGSRGMSVSGRVRIEEGTGLAASALLKSLAVQLRNTSTNGQVFGSPNADGTLSIRQVPSGEYRVAITNLPSGSYVKRALFGESDALNSSIQVNAVDSKSLDIVISPNAGQLDGQILNEAGDPVPGAQVVLVPDNRDRIDLFKPALAGQDGWFAIEGIAPGEYKLFTWESLESYAFFDPDLLKQVEEMGKVVRIRESSTQTISSKSISITH